MNRAFLVAGREYLENVRTKGFWIGIMMMPLILLMFALVPLLVESTREVKRYAVIDQSGGLLDAVDIAISTAAPAAGNLFARVDPGTSDIARLNRMIDEGELFAYFVIGPDPVESSAGSRYVSKNLTDRDLLNWFGGSVSREVRKRRLEREQLDPAIADWLNEPVDFAGLTVAEGGAEEQVKGEDIARQWAPVVFVYLLWISVLINTQMLLTNTIEEKSNKLIEVLLSSVSPVELMGGKIIGIAATGLTIILTWVLMASIFFLVLPQAVGLTPPIDVSSIISDPWFLGSFVIYFLLGYLLYAALLVGLGSVCNNLKEAQNMMMPVQLVQMIPLFVMVPIGRDPNGVLAQILSYVPPLTPFIMMNRAAAPPTTMEYVTTTVLLLISIAAALWVAARIFRIGILMTGQPPTLREIWRLLRPVSNP